MEGCIVHYKVKELLNKILKAALIRGSFQQAELVKMNWERSVRDCDVMGNISPCNAFT